MPYLYYNNATDRLIGRVALDGTGHSPAFIDPTTTDNYGVAFDETYIYWGSQASECIGRAKLDGTGLNSTWLAISSKPRDVVVTATHIYWANNVDGCIGRAKVAGTNVEPKWLSVGPIYGLCTDGVYLYWAGYTAKFIGRAKLDGSEKNESWLPVTRETRAIAVDTAGHVYWGGRFVPVVGRANTDGTNVVHSWATLSALEQATTALTSSGGGFFGAVSSAKSVARLDPDGSNPNPAWLTPTGSIITGLAAEQEDVLVAEVSASPSILLSVAAPAVAAGPSASSSEQGHHGLPLPFPSVLANPARLGPPRFTALERKTLGLD